ncbi:serine-rich adhesin for platelets-like [Gigantopelta aegis]|uniref:serine-rich adhesin for platelets-like n=1 Tax=Gigantopelta aegis TaxID=1735272 RepID=UPI001B888D32|nr:serine-rich adhesin for platelets-like [Gigantopelta aegis]
MPPQSKRKSAVGNKSLARPTRRRSARGPATVEETVEPFTSQMSETTTTGPDVSGQSTSQMSETTTGPDVSGQSTSQMSETTTTGPDVSGQSTSQMSETTTTGPGVPGQSTSQMSETTTTGPGVSAIAAEVIRQLKEEGLVLRQAPSATGTSPAAAKDVRSGPRFGEVISTAPAPSTSQEQPTFITGAIEQLTSTAAQGRDDYSINGLNGSISRPLDINVDVRHKEKIWSDQFVDFGQLLQNRPIDEFDISFQTNTFSLIPKSRPVPIRSMDVWNSAFQIYVTIVVKTRPDLAVSLMKYANIVQRLKHVCKACGGPHSFRKCSKFDKANYTNTAAPHNSAANQKTGSSQQSNAR